MFFILPLGHDVELRRMPKVTFGLIILNVIVFLLTHFIINSEIENLAKTQVDLFEKGMALLAQAESSEGNPAGFAFSIPELREKKTPDEVLEFIASKLKTKREMYKQWLEEYEDYKKSAQEMLLNKIGFVPKDFPSIGFLTHIFVHEGWLHLLFNMWFLYLVGMALEDTWGRFTFLGFYLLGGIVAALLQYGVQTQSAIPMIGASGAVAAVMGAFAIRFAREKIDCLFLALIVIRPVIRRFSAPAWLLLVIWFGIQLFYAELYKGMGEEGGVAFWAHVGGFVFGAALATFFKLGKIEETFIKPELEKMPEYQEDYLQDTRLIVALDLMDKQDYKGALARVESLLLDKPQDPDARIVKARLLFLNKETDESKALYLELMKEAKGQADKKMIATLYDEFMERFPKAPLPPDLLFAAGRVFFEMEYERNALEAFSELEKSGELPDFSAKALFYLGRIKAELENNPAAAKVLFQDFLSKYPDHPWADQARELLNRISL